MNKIIKIITPRLVIREITKKDSADIFTVFSDKEILKYTDNDLLESHEESLKLIERFQYENQIGSSYRWGVCLKPSEKIIGVVSLYHIDYKHKFASIGSVLLKEFQGKGIIPEAQNATFEFAFNTLFLNRLEGQVYTKNIPSIKKLKKMGFKREGRLRENFMIANKLRDSYMYSLLKSEFITNNISIEYS